MSRVVGRIRERYVFCPNCGSVVAFTKADEESRQVGMNEYDTIIKCPTKGCGKNIMTNNATLDLDKILKETGSEVI